MDRKPKQQESHSPPPDSITVKPKAQEELISLAHGGDAILIIPSNSPSSAVEKRYLVSIAILSQASRRFRELFAGSNSTFSLEKCADGVVQCKFPASDVKAAEAILSKLHYQDVAIHDPKTPQELEAVMRQAGAFTCTTAIRPWMRDWVSQIPTATNLSDQKALIMSAHYSQDPKLVDAMMARAAWGATKAEWERFEDKAKEKMPPHRLQAIFNHIESYSNRMECVIQNTEVALQQGGSWENCGSDSRVVLYFNTLRKSDIWPTAKCFRQHDLVNISNNLQMVANTWQHHQCSGRRACPLKGQIKAVSDKVLSIMEEAQNLWPRMPLMNSLENS